MKHLTQLEAATRLGVSPSTIDRMIRRNELSIEKEHHGSQYKVRVLIDDAVPGGEAAGLANGAGGEADGLAAPAASEAGEAGGPAGPAGGQPDMIEVTILRERVKSLQELDVYHREQLKEAEMRFQLLLQTMESLPRALPAPAATKNTNSFWSWWPFRKAAL